MPRLAFRRPLETLLWTVALFCSAAYVGGRTLGEHEHHAALDAFAAARGELRSLAAAAPAAGQDGRAGDVSGTGMPQPDTARWAPGRVERYAEAQAASAAAGHLPLAVLSMPRLALEVPVFAESSERNLNRGAALVAAAQGDGGVRNIAIAGHRDGWFRALEGAAVGDLIELQELGQRRRYRVSALHIVAPTDLSPLAPTDESSLTLITCYPFHFVGSAPLRFIVRATAEPVPGATAPPSAFLHAPGVSP